MALAERAKGAALAWGDSMLPPGPTRDRVTSVARRFGFSYAPPASGVPEHLRSRFHPSDEPRQRELAAALTEDYFGAQFPTAEEVQAYLHTSEGASDLRDHLVERLERNRGTVIPWLDHVRPLAGTRILEVGAGDGASTVALAEQGARVLAVDVNERYLKANAARCRIAGLDDVRFAAANAAELDRVAGRGEFDLIVIYAALEHMTFAERMAALSGAWSLLDPGGHLVVVETPNRLWYLDDHTSRTVFFHWLPDDVAIRYAAYTDRPLFNTAFQDHHDLVDFARWGRGVSFHDFVLGLGMRAEALPVVSAMEAFLGRPRWLPHTRDGRYLRMLHSLAPGIHKGFFFSYLDLALEKR